MTNYTDIVGGNPLQPSAVAYVPITLSATTQFSWPYANEDNGQIVAGFMDVTATAGSLNFMMPPANQTSAGQPSVFRNVGSNTFTVTDSGGNTIVAIPAGQVFYVYPTSNATVNGTWSSFALGIGTSALSAAGLAGLGLVALGSLLNQSHPVTSHNSAYTLGTNDRAQTNLWTGGAGTFTALAAATLGNNWFTLVKNSGSGNLAVAANSGEMIDGAGSVSLAPNDAAFVISSGTALYTVGLGRSVNSTITRTSISVAGNTDVTLTATQAAFTIIEFTGALTGNINIIVPTAVNVWYMLNNTSGAFTLTVKTASGTGYAIPQGNRAILECDGTNVINTVTLTSGTVTSVATGTGLTGGPITSAGTISIANTAVAAGAYSTNTQTALFTVNAQGQITAAANSGVDLLSQSSAASTYAPLASPALTGTPTTPTATHGTNTTQIASTAFVLANLPSLTQPTFTSLLSSTGTYTTPANVVRLRVRIAGGGGGSGGSTGAGGNGGQTIFGAWTANSASGGAANGVYTPGGTGGSGGTNGTGTLIVRLKGGDGSSGEGSGASSSVGGSNPFGGAGVSKLSTGTGSAGSPNTGAGGGGTTFGASCSGAGGAGEYVEFQISSPSATYSYTVGAAGAAGSGTAGAIGGSGVILIEECYY